MPDPNAQPRPFAAPVAPQFATPDEPAPPMAAKALFSGSLVVDATDPRATVPETVLLLPGGAFYGRDGRGPWLVKDATAVIAATDSQAAGTDLVIDYDHQSDLAAVAGTGGRAPAAGWITALTPAENGAIRAQVEWTQEARRAIAAREYRYLSPVFAHDNTGRVIRLLRAGLTNTPNLALPALNTEMTAMDTLGIAQPSAAGSPTETTAAEPKTNAASLSDRLATLLGLSIPAPDEAIVAQVRQLMSRPQPLPVVRAALGLPDMATTDEIVTALKAQANTAAGADSVGQAETALAAQVTTLQSQLHAVLRDRAEADVEAMVRQGRVLPSERETLVTLAMCQPDHFQAIARARPVLLEPGALLTGSPPRRGADASLSRDEQAVCRQLGLESGAFRQALTAEACQ